MKATSNILFVGGCLLNQASLRREELFYIVLRDQLLEVLDKNDFQFHFANYWSYSSLPAITGEALIKKSTDLVVLFIRPYPVMALLKPLVKFGSNQGKKHWTIHPALFRRNRNWDIKLNPPPPTPTDTHRRRNKFSFRDLNLAVGKMLGLEKWMHNYLKEILVETTKVCATANSRLLILSPPDNPESYSGSAVCRNIAAMLQEFCDSRQIEFVGIYEKNVSIFESDGIHFNSAGHRFLAEKLISPVLNRIREQKSNYFTADNSVKNGI